MFIAPLPHCLIAPLLVLLSSRLVEPHAEAETHRLEDLFDLVERLPAEVLGLEHLDRKSTRLNSSHVSESRMPSSA